MQKAGKPGLQPGKKQAVETACESEKIWIKKKKTLKYPVQLYSKNERKPYLKE